jgi:hypothetical protein
MPTIMRWFPRSVPIQEGAEPLPQKNSGAKERAYDMLGF